MKIKSVECIVTGVEIKKSTKTNEPYLMVNILDPECGQVFSIVHKQIEDMPKLQAMKKYKLSFSLVPSKFGLNLAITEIGQELGSI